MSKKKNTAPVAVPQSYEAADKLLAELGQKKIELAKLELRLGGKVAKLTALIERSAGPLKARLKALEEQIAAYSDANRAELLTDDVKHHDMPAGRIGWRTNPASVEFKSGFKVADIVLSILKMKLRRKFLRMKLEIDKEAMLKDQDKAATVPGIRIKKDVETFYIEPKGAELSEGAP